MPSKESVARRIEQLSREEFDKFEAAIGEDLSQDDYAHLVRCGAKSIDFERVCDALGVRSDTERSIRATESQAWAAWSSLAISILALVFSVIALVKSGGK